MAICLPTGTESAFDLPTVKVKGAPQTSPLLYNLLPKISEDSTTAKHLNPPRVEQKMAESGSIV